MGFLSDGGWWVFPVLTLIGTVIYTRTPMSRLGDSLILLVTIAFAVVSFVLAGWVAGIVTLVLAWIIGGVAAPIFHRRSVL